MYVLYCIVLYYIALLYIFYVWVVCMYVYIHAYVMYCISCLFMYELNCNTLLFAFTFLIHFFIFISDLENLFACMLVWSMCLHTIFIPKKDHHLSTKHERLSSFHAYVAMNILWLPRSEKQYI